MKELISILSNTIPNIDFEKETDIVERGLVDSLDIVNLVVALSDAYGMEIPTEAVTIENFSSAATIKKMIDNLLKA